MAQSHPHVTGLEAHLIVVPEVADAYVLIHVGVVKVLPQPADITPVEIPFAFTAVRETRVRPEHRSAAPEPRVPSQQTDHPCSSLNYFLRCRMLPA